MRARLLFALLAVLPFAGCLGPRAGFMDGFMDDFSVDVEMGTVGLRSVRVDDSYELTSATADVRVHALVEAHRAGEVTLLALLDDAPCSRLGPPSRPDTPIDRESVREEVEGSRAFTLDLSGRVLPGSAYSVYVEVASERGMGPVFGQCRDLRAI